MDVNESLFFNRTVLLGIFVGGIVLVLMYILKLFNNEEKVGHQRKNEKGAQHIEKKKETVGGKTKKKVSENKWSTKADKQGFTHPWLIKSLKGHTGEVLDMDFSSNNKYLISCADEDLGGSTESSDSAKDTSRPPSVEPSPKVKGLSRRQRKNRRKDDISPEVRRKTKKKSDLRSTKKQAPSTSLKIWAKLKMEEAQLYKQLQKHTLTMQEMFTMGYPMVTDRRIGQVLIYKTVQKQNRKCSATKFDVNAEEFVPKTQAKVSSDEYDSGQGSGNSSDSGENIDESESVSDHPPVSKNMFWTYKYKAPVNQVPARRFDSIAVPVCSNIGVKFYPAIAITHKHHQDWAVVYLSSLYYSHLTQAVRLPVNSNVTSTYLRKTCVRCCEDFLITESEYITRDACCYHWGKLHNIHPGVVGEYTCCQAPPATKGCTESKCHVWNGIEDGPNYLTGYVQTRKRRCTPSDGNFGVYALDCEMSYTVKGLELTKVTVVGPDGRVVYDSFVKPELEVVDYNTRFSGITSKDLKCAKSLKDVQNDLMGFINADSIIIGHGLDNDLRALKMVHYKVIDTSFSFPHHLGLPFRRSLKQLAWYVLKTDIQTGSHNSYEDAVTAMELILSLVRKENQTF